jgi:hypothetical protein
MVQKMQHGTEDAALSARTTTQEAALLDTSRQKPPTQPGTQATLLPDGGCPYVIVSQRLALLPPLLIPTAGCLHVPAPRGPHPTMPKGSYYGVVSQEAPPA